MPGNILDMMEVYEDLDNHIAETGYDVRCFGYDPYNARDFVERWEEKMDLTVLRRLYRVHEQNQFH